MPTQKFCSFCKAFTFTKLDDFDEILWAAAKIGKELKIACPEHFNNLKKWMHATLELHGSVVPSTAQEPIGCEKEKERLDARCLHFPTKGGEGSAEVLPSPSQVPKEEYMSCKCLKCYQNGGKSDVFD